VGELERFGTWHGAADKKVGETADRNVRATACRAVGEPERLVTWHGAADRKVGETADRIVGIILNLG
jgi:hypothetical protein